MVNRKLDEQAIHEANMKRSVEEKFKSMPLDEIFTVITRSGAQVFIPMIENAISRVVEEVLDRKLREVAVGVSRGLEEKIAQAIPKIEETGKHGDKWTKEQDEALIVALARLSNTKLKKGEIHRRVGEAIGRSKAAVHYRWHGVLSTQKWAQELYKEAQNEKV